MFIPVTISYSMAHTISSRISSNFAN